VRRETPFGESEARSKRSLYKIDDPFFRLWFRVVAPHRGRLAAGTRADRLDILRENWPALVGQAWEDICRSSVADPSFRVGGRGRWSPASRWWHGNQPEWDLVAETAAGDALLLGEAKWSERPFTRRDLEQLSAGLLSKAPPILPARYRDWPLERALFVPDVADGTPARIHGIHVVTARKWLHRS
jgi:hypothetical protein